MTDNNEHKRMWIANTEPSDFKAKTVMICTIIALGIAALLTCVYVIIPALLSNVSDFVG
jgi:hypothetical protein